MLPITKRQALSATLLRTSLVRGLYGHYQILSQRLPFRLSFYRRSKLSEPIQVYTGQHNRKLRSLLLTVLRKGSERIAAV
jgi:hypothetical protein